MPRKYRPRKEFKFWLYHDRDEDSRLMEFIQYCKQTRQFARVVRDGIRLIWSLREGNNNVLFELFPHLERQFKPDAEELMSSSARCCRSSWSPRLCRSLHWWRPVKGQQSRAVKNHWRLLRFALPLLDDDDDGDTHSVNT